MTPSALSSARIWGSLQAQAVELGKEVADPEEPIQEVELTMDTCDLTSWRSRKRHPQSTDATCVLAQETHVLAADVGQASQWAAKRKWHSIWTPALQGKTERSSSGGTAIFLKASHGLSACSRLHETEEVLAPGKLTRA